MTTERKRQQLANISPRGDHRKRGLMILQHAIWYLCYTRNGLFDLASTTILTDCIVEIALTQPTTDQ